MSSPHGNQLYLVLERDIAPRYDNLLAGVVGDGMGALGGDGDTLPLGGAVHDVVQTDYGLTLHKIQKWILLMCIIYNTAIPVGCSKS